MSLENRNANSFLFFFVIFSSLSFLFCVLSLVFDFLFPSHYYHDDVRTQVFAAVMVDDAAEFASKSVAVSTDEFGHKSITSSSLVFTIISGDVIMGGHVPNGDLNLRLVHTYEFEGQQRTLFLNCSEELRKPPLKGHVKTESELHRSIRLSFSSIKNNALGLFRLMHIDSSEFVALTNAKAYMLPLLTYTENLADSNFPLHKLDVVSTINTLYQAIDDIVKGAFKSHTAHEEWVDRANQLDPLSFADLFRGFPDAFVQQVFRDVKLLDAVFNLAMAAYHRFPPDENPWVKDDMEGPRAVQKFSYVLIQRLCDGNDANEAYIGRRKLKSFRDGTSSDDASPSMMELLRTHLIDPLGASTTLSMLLSDNSGLMKKYAEPSLVNEVSTLIQVSGPQSRFINFFSVWN